MQPNYPSDLKVLKNLMVPRRIFMVFLDVVVVVVVVSVPTNVNIE